MGNYGHLPITSQGGYQKAPNRAATFHLRIPMDSDCLSSAVHAQREDKTRPRPEGGIEPRLPTGDLTPKDVQRNLKEFLNICARRTGMERILAIRRRIRRINYSKKTISVEFLFGGPLDSTSQDLTRPPDGKSLLNQNLTPVPHSGTKSFSPPARTSHSILLPPAPKAMRPGRDERPDLMEWFTPFEKVPRGGVEPPTPGFSDLCSTS